MSLSRRTTKDLLLAGLIALVTLLIWAYKNDRLLPSHWQSPIGIAGDGTLVLSFIKAAQEGDFPLFLSKHPHRLGAPFGADWNSWPITEEFLYWSTGQLARLIGLHSAAALAMAMAHVLAAVAFYAACRLLGKPRLWAWVFGLLFGLSQYIFWRGLGHLIIGYCWHVPLCLVVVFYAFSERGLLKNKQRITLTVGVSLITGWQNPYFTFVYMQFLLVAALVRGWRHRSFTAVLPAVAAVALTMTAFLSMQADTLVDQLRTHRGSLSATRTYVDMELYALKPFDLILPSQWNFPFLNGRVADYVKQRATSGEYPLSYMGLVAGLGALLLVGIMFRDAVIRNNLSSLTLKYGIPSLWLIALGMVGGVLGFAALLTRIYFLRGANRFSIYLIALIFFFLTDVLTRWTRRLHPIAKWFVVGGLLLVGFWDLPLSWITKTDQFYGQMWQSMQTFVSATESRTGRDAKIFVLPVMDFPEVPPVYREDHYAPLALYLPDSTLRFSYGDMKGDFRDVWQRRLEKLPAPRLAAELRRLGFSGLVVVRDAYPDGGQALLGKLAVAGYPVASVSAAPTNFSFVPLAVVDASGSGSGVSTLPDTAGITLRKGWNPIETSADGETVLWTEGNAAIGLLQARDAAGPGSLNVRLVSLEPRRVHVRLNGVTLVELALSSHVETSLEDVPLPLVPGENVLEILTDKPGAQASALDRRIVAVCLKGLEISGLTSSTRERVDRIERNTLRISASDLAGAAPSAWRDATRLEVRDIAGDRWQESRVSADSASLQGTVGWSVAKMEFLPAGRRFGVSFRVTPAAAQIVDSAPVFSCHGIGLRGATFEKISGQTDFFQLYLGTGTTYLPMGDPIRLEPGRGYVCTLNVTEEAIALTVTGNGTHSEMVHPLTGIPPLDSIPWRWGNWPLGDRPFAGRIELLAMQGSPLPSTATTEPKTQTAVAP